jgi:hypothetical protein
VQIGILGLNIAFNDAPAHVHGSWQVVGVEFAVFADIDEDKLLAAVEPGLDRVDAGFADALLGIVDDFQKARRMLMCHGVKASG